MWISCWSAWHRNWTWPRAWPPSAGITGGVAHEIKNPLNAISLRLDFLRAELGAPRRRADAEIDILSQRSPRGWIGW